MGGHGHLLTVNRGFEKHLMMYPKEVWDRKTKEINQLNIYKKQHRQVMDKADRVLLPKSLLEYAAIKNEVVLFAYQDQVEVWSTEYYEQMTSDEPEDFSSIADSVFGDDDAARV